MFSGNGVILKIIRTGLFCALCVMIWVIFHKLRENLIGCVYLLEMFFVISVFSYFDKKNKYLKVLIGLCRALYGLALGGQLSSYAVSQTALSSLALDNLSEASSVGIENTLLIIGIIVFCIISSLFSRLDIEYNFIYFTVPLSLTVGQLPSYQTFIPVSLVIKERILAWRSAESRRADVRSLWHDDVYSDSDHENIIPRKHYNVVVIYTEGLSSGVLSPEVTPNIWNMLKHSVHFSGYFNHTAATYRGLRGQNSSSYQLNDIPEQGGEHYLTMISDILKKYDYKTYFQTSDGSDSNLYGMLSTMRFDHVYGRDDVPAEQRKKWLAPGDITDAESYDLLWKNLNILYQKGQHFYYGMYTVGTHVGLDSPDIKYGDGKNAYLNKFHNMDYQFGQFLNKFNNSPVSDNTIIIFTADHATYPQKDFMETFHTKSTEFVDQVPLIFYDKNNQRDLELNADGKNSLDLLPTILDILGMQHQRNNFLGCSLFDDACHSDFDHITAIGLGAYLRSSGNEVHRVQLDKRMSEKILNLQLNGG